MFVIVTTVGYYYLFISANTISLITMFKKRIITRIGDIFYIEIDNEYKC